MSFDCVVVFIVDVVVVVSIHSLTDGNMMFVVSSSRFLSAFCLTLILPLIIIDGPDSLCLKLNTTIGYNETTKMYLQFTKMKFWNINILLLMWVLIFVSFFNQFNLMYKVSVTVG